MVTLHRRTGRRIVASVLATALAMGAPTVALARSSGAGGDSVRPGSSLVGDARRNASFRRSCTYQVTSYGNVNIDVTVAELLEAGFSLGDVVDVTLGDLSLTVPICGNYREVSVGKPGLFAPGTTGSGDNVYLSVSMGDFAATYGIAKTEKGHPVASEFSVTMREVGGYPLSAVLEGLIYTKDRADYPALTDAEFANFREVTAGRIAPGRLYRSSSPVDPTIGRSSYADACLSQAGVTCAVDLADTEEKIASYDGYDDTYVSGIAHACIDMRINLKSGDFGVKLVGALTYMADNPGVYDVFCQEGKDRTGFVCALLECLMGADEDEVVDDFMRSFENYYDLRPTDAGYAGIAKVGIVDLLCASYGLETLEGADLEREATDYLLSLGMDADRIDALKQVLATPGEGRLHDEGSEEAVEEAVVTSGRRIVLGIAA